MNDNKNITHEQLRNTLVKLQNDNFRFVLDERDNYFRYNEKKDELTDDVFEQFSLSELTDLRVVDDVYLMFKFDEWNYTLFATKTVLGKF